MYRRKLAAAFAALILAPVAGSGQTMPLLDDPTWSPKMRVTPFVGYMPSVERTETWHFNDGTSTSFANVSLELGGGTAAGVNVEMRLNRRFGVTGAGAWASRDETTFVVMQDGSVTGVDGSNTFMVRLGGAMYLFEEESELVMRRLNASVFAGGVIMHDRPRNDLGTQQFLDNGTHFGVNIGVNGELPFASDRFAVQVGVEDNIMWWREGPLARLAYEYFNRPGTSVSQTTASADVAHVWLLRAGISYRFR